MFVRQSTYDKMKQRAEIAEAAYWEKRRECNKHIEEWNAMIKGYNKILSEVKTLRPFLNSPKQFTQEEIQKLILLCHPDKHDGKPMAVELTQRLIKMRD